MARKEFMFDSALKSAQWERAKGELRALVALQASYTDLVPQHMRTKPDRWIQLSDRVEDFIKAVEDDALQE